MRSHRDLEAFERLGEELRDNVQALALDLNVQQVFNGQQDRADEQEDVGQLMQYQQQILEAMEAHFLEQQGAMAAMHPAAVDLPRHVKASLRRMALDLFKTRAERQYSTMDAFHTLLVPFAEPVECGSMALLGSRGFGDGYKAQWGAEAVAVKMILWASAGDAGRAAGAGSGRGGCCRQRGQRCEAGRGGSVRARVRGAGSRWMPGVGGLGRAWGCPAWAGCL